MTPKSLLSRVDEAIKSIGLGYDITSDIRLKHCKDLSSLIELEDTEIHDVVLPGGLTISGVPKSIKCDKGERIRFKSDVLSFQQMSEQFNQELSLSGKIPSGLFNNMFDFTGCWQKDAANTKTLAFDGWFITLYAFALSKSQIVLLDHVKHEVPSTWDPAALARFIERFGTHIIIGVKMGGKDVVYIRQQHSSNLQHFEVQKRLKDLADMRFQETSREYDMASKETYGKDKFEMREQPLSFLNIGPSSSNCTKEDIVIIPKRRGGKDTRDLSHIKWLNTVHSEPDVISMSFLPITSLLNGVPGSGFLNHAINLYLRVEQAREHLANLIGADPKEIIFTSGATESNNMSIKGVARFFKRGGKKNHIITCQTEHKCVLDSCRHLQDEGFKVTYLPVQSNGLIDMAQLEAAMTPETAIVSIMTVNNEIGVVQPVEEIGRLCRSKKVYFHTDAAQAVGKIPIDVNKMNVDLMSISGHKIYGPKGIGACYVRRRPRVRLDPIISGGGQERGLRSGTLAPHLAIGIGEAARICKEEMAYDSKRITSLSNRLLEGLLSLEHTTLNGDRERHYPGCVNVSFAYVEGESLLMALKDIALSSGSACTSASLEPSYVLRALGSSDESAHSSIRFGIGRFTTESEIDYVLKAVRERVTFLRELSPLWELVQEGIDLNTIEWSQH